MIDFQKVKSSFKGIKEDRGDTFRAMCPAHPDVEASLSIKHDRKEGRVIFKCFAGCESKDIISAAGLEWSDCFEEELKSDRSGRTETAVYKYIDENNNFIFEKVRYKTKEKEKNFSQRRFIDSCTVWGLYGGTHFETYPGSNEWTKNKGNKVNPREREFQECMPILYNLPELITAVKNGNEVYIVEGEKDVENLKKWGLIATCNFDGASKSSLKPKWKKEYNHYFNGAKVIILADNDESGKAHSENIANNLFEIAEYIKCPELPGLEEKGDVSDWIQQGNSKETLIELVNNSDNWDPEVNLKDSLICFNFSDVGNAERLVAMYGKNIRYSPIRKKWLIWSGRHWDIDFSGKIDTFARNVIRKLQAEGIALPNDEEHKKLKETISKFVLRSESDGRLKAMVSQAKTFTSITLVETDSNPYLLNVKNGTLDMRTGLIRKHSRNDYITKLIDIEYSPKATCPNWIEFTNKIFLNDTDLINYIQKSVGYSLTGDASLQCFYILHGKGSNGKGTFIQTIERLLGPYYSTLNPESLMERTSNVEGAREDLAKLEGTRFVCVNECDENRYFDENLLKRMSSGANEKITVRRMFESYFDLSPEFKMWMTTNGLPKIKGTDKGIWRRVRKIPFEYDFEQDPDKVQDYFGKMLLPEISGILNWAIEGCLKWQQEGMELPDAVSVEIEKYKVDMDPIARFIDDTCMVSETCKSRISELYDTYCDWCKENKEYTLSSIKFTKRLKDKGFQQTKSGSIRFWKGIGLQSELDDIPLIAAEDNITPFWS